MSAQNDRAKSVLDTRDLSEDEINFLFIRAGQLESEWKRSSTRERKTRLVSLLFFEASTRTRVSFQMAAARMGYIAISTGWHESSLEKGETYTDTVLNIVAMNPDAIVIRYGLSPELDQLIPNLKIPVINAGSGISAHPTQALLDAFTIWKERAKLRDQKVLIVGDIRHSRVAQSNFELLTRLGAEVAVSGPAEWMPSQLSPKIRFFDNFEHGLKWADVYMGLRVQKERHGVGDDDTGANAATKFTSQFGLNQERLKLLADHAIILHPGPVNYGVEFVHEVTLDPRSRVLQQVSNGVLIRAALLEMVLEKGTQ
jgi:aspartate carbamoyltransferase catalytic subunit